MLEQLGGGAGDGRAVEPDGALQRAEEQRLDGRTVAQQLHRALVAVVVGERVAQQVLHALPDGRRAAARVLQRRHRALVGRRGEAVRLRAEQVRLVGIVHLAQLAPRAREAERHLDAAERDRAPPRRGAAAPTEAAAPAAARAVDTHRARQLGHLRHRHGDPRGRALDEMAGDGGLDRHCQRLLHDGSTSRRARCVEGGAAAVERRERACTGAADDLGQHICRQA